MNGTSPSLEVIHSRRITGEKSRLYLEQAEDRHDVGGGRD